MNCSSLDKELQIDSSFKLSLIIWESTCRLDECYDRQNGEYDVLEETGSLLWRINHV